jgi:hypothetical protein
VSIAARATLARLHDRLGAIISFSDHLYVGNAAKVAALQGK